MFSMTGYGKAEYSNGGVSLVVELRSVNNRNFDLSCKIPHIFLPFEDSIRKTVMQYVTRGKIDLYVNFSDRREENSVIDVDLIKVKNYFDAGKKIADFTGLQNDLTVSQLIKMPDVIIASPLQDENGLENIIKETVSTACENFNNMRKIEGEKLVKDMLCRMDTIEGLRKNITERAPLLAKEYKEKLSERIKEALADVKFDEARLLNEVAFYTDKVNIDEELTRLGSHINQFRSIINTVGAGKKLDFLMQEFNRETNTICSKSNDITITQYALSLKNEIEKVREQVQNLE